MAQTAYRILLQHEAEQTDTRSAISITRLILTDAFLCGASDIHLDPAPDMTQIRLRIDGALSDAYSLPRAFHTELVSRLKILSGLRIDEHFSPQDGRFTFKTLEDMAEFDVRISVLPTQYGESIVLRLLISPGEKASLNGLGLEDAQQSELRQALSYPHGMIVVVGPTGSGKTTTLYALIREILGTERSIISIEDPIEYSLLGVRQVQVQPRHGLGFAEGLRAMLRQDPDVIVVGEMRDAETANLAVSAAHTGHLVLSTLHAVDTKGTFSRFEELGVSRTRLKAIRLTIVAQKLVRNQTGQGRHGEFTLAYA